MSDGTPTVGSLRRRLKRLEEGRRQDVERDVADLEARMETVEAEMGLLDGEDSGQDINAKIGRAVKRGIQDAERKHRRRGRRRGQLACLNSQEDEEAETDEAYEDPTPSFVGEEDDDEDWLAARTEADTARTEDGIFLEKSGEVRNAELYFAEDGEFYLTTPTIREGTPHFSGVWAEPATLRALAGIIESVQETDNKRREP